MVYPKTYRYITIYTNISNCRRNWNNNVKYNIIRAIFPYGIQLKSDISKKLFNIV